MTTTMFFSAANRPKFASMANANQKFIKRQFFTGGFDNAWHEDALNNRTMQLNLASWD
jgi:hypothetical protein